MPGDDLQQARSTDRRQKLRRRLNRVVDEETRRQTQEALAAAQLAAQKEAEAAALEDDIGPMKRKEYEETRKLLERLMVKCRAAEEMRPVLKSLVFLHSSTNTITTVHPDPQSRRNADYFSYKAHIQGLQASLDQIDDLDMELVRKGIAKVQKAIDHLVKDLQQRIEAEYESGEAARRKEKDIRRDCPVVDTSKQSPNAQRLPLANQLLCPR